MLVRCLYASRAGHAGAGRHRWIRSLEQSRRNNPPRGITGLLCFTSDVFVQVLEGGRDEVCDLYNAIVCDERHSHVRLLSYEEIAERRFRGWTMGQVNVDSGQPRRCC